MTGDPQADRSALGVLVGTGLLVGALCWPRAPAAEEVAVAPAPAGLQVDPPEVVLQHGGLVLERQAWRFEGDSGVAWRVAVPLPGKARVHPSAQVVPFSELLPPDEGPWAAINGGFYEAGPMGLVVSDGVESNPWSARGGSGIFQWSAEAGPAVVHRSAWKAGPTQAVQSIDRLVDAGKSLVKERDGARAAARSAVAISGEHLWLVALATDDSLEPLPDGQGVQLRGTVVRGLPLWTFAEYLADHLGAVTALNLDGAISTQLAVQVPGQRFEVRGERGTINSLVIRP